MGAISYPLMVSSCILAFSVYSLVKLRERNSLAQYAAFVGCLAGIVLVSLPSRKEPPPEPPPAPPPVAAEVQAKTPLDAAQP